VSWTDGTQQVATEEHLRARSLCGKPGEYFRCCMCGYKFKLGDKWRWQFTNNVKGAGGNPIVCAKCDGPDVVERWAKKIASQNDDSNWYFNRRSK